MLISASSIYSCCCSLLLLLFIFIFILMLGSFDSLFDSFFYVNSATVFLNFLRKFYYMEPFPIKFSFSIACYMQIGYFVPRPSRENWKFHIDTNDDIPHVLLYCGLDIVSQCPVRSRYGHRIDISDADYSIFYSCNSSYWVSWGIFKSEF